MGGASNDFDAWDQGISFFLPNGTWLQPPGYVHKMIAETWQPNALKIDANSSTTASAQKSDDGKTLVLRYANPAPATAVTVHLKGGMSDVAYTSATTWTLSSDDPNAANPPGQPSLISPVKATLPSFGDGTVLKIPANSYVIVEASIGDLPISV